MRFSAPLYLFDQKDCSLKVVPLGLDPYKTLYKQTGRVSVPGEEVRVDIHLPGQVALPN
jgi:hypothetical protein